MLLEQLFCFALRIVAKEKHFYQLSVFKKNNVDKRGINNLSLLRKL